MKKILYFAYGSNLLYQRLWSRLSRICEVKKVGVYKLEGYKLVFNASQYHGKFALKFANVVKGNQNDFVEGVLYEISEEAFTYLDRFEALYHRYFFDLPNNKTACVYICTDSEHCFEGLPELEYLNIIIEGCLENNLVSTYNKLVDFKTSNYKLRGGSKHKKIKI